MRAALTSAIASCAAQRFQRSARQFLAGLSTDELEYIADYLGACVLESFGGAALSRRELADGIARFESVHAPLGAPIPDHEHKMILLLEYLCRSRLMHCSLVGRSRHAMEGGL